MYPQEHHHCWVTAKVDVKPINSKPTIYLPNAFLNVLKGLNAPPRFKLYQLSATLYRHSPPSSSRIAIMISSHSTITSLSLVVLTLTFAVPSLAFFPTDAEIHLRRRTCISQPNLLCALQPTTGNNGTGVVLFRPTFGARRPATSRCRIIISATVQGLTPGAHGFHIHTFGDVRASDGTSTGGHFGNPEGSTEGVAHGYPNDAVRHWGDFGNLFVNTKGSASYRRIDQVITLGGIVGRGMIIHASRDKGADFQPTGAAGARVASCVIGIANPDI